MGGLAPFLAIPARNAPPIIDPLGSLLISVRTGSPFPVSRGALYALIGIFRTRGLVLAIEDVRRSILVTGGGGFIGSRLVRALLEKGQRVKVLDIQRGLLGPVRSRRLEFVGLESGASMGGMANEEAVQEAVEEGGVVVPLRIAWE